ncbi:MAG: oligosaccharide flippase family protein [Nitrososphaerota archaeon]|jgi:O-antigen/teichoic acid export membrane protein|nr:oligosaccharide flippase family protein [Nitrososphaerota archaeon]
MDDKALQMGKSSTAGSFYLLIGLVCSSVILALGTLILGNVLSAEELGLYSLVLIPSTVIAYFRDLGVNSAMTQRIANLRAADKYGEIHDVIFSGVLFEIVSGAILSLVCFAIANNLAIYLSHPELSSLIALMSVSIFASSLVSAALAIFVGFEKMKFNSLTQILQAVTKTFLGPLLVLLGYSVLGVVLGYIISVVVSGLVGVLLVYLFLFRPLCKLKVDKCNVKQNLLPMLKYGIPLTFSGIVTGVLPQIFTSFMSPYASPDMLGNYQAAIYCAVLISFISVPISTALFPAFSKLNTVKEPELARTVFSSSVKYLSIFLIPTTMLIMTLSAPLISTLFPEGGIFEAFFSKTLFHVGTESKFPYAPTFLMLSSIVNLFVLFGSVSLSAFQTGIGKTNQIMKQSLLSIAISVPFAYAIITYFGVFGAGNESLVVLGGILAILVSTIPGMTWGLIWAWKNYRVKADFKSSGKIFLSSLIASIVAYAATTILNAPYILLLIVGAIIFLLVYLACAPLLGAVNRADIDNLKVMTSELGIISKIMAIPLMFMRKICRNP